MPLLSRIFGWSPPDNSDYVEVAVTPDQLQPIENPTFHISNPDPFKQVHHPANGNILSSSPGSTTSTLSTDSDAPNQRRAGASANKKRSDPNWIARPRNEFILFRCDYVRKHSREGKRIRKAPGAEAEKTLSKQAAEAWHHLSPEERLYWKERANGERNEHARRYPDYCYRPRKGGIRRRYPMRSSSTKAIEPVDKASGAGNNFSQPQTSTPLTQSSEVSAFTIKNSTPRRYSSVPEFTATGHVNRRLRSTVSHGWLTAPTTLPGNGAGFVPSPRQYAPLPLRLQSSPTFLETDYTDSQKPQSPSGIIHSTSSSLLNWNGERMVASPPQPTQFLSPSSVSFISGVDVSNSLTLSEFVPGKTPIVSSQGFSISDAAFQSPGDIWMPLQDYTSDDGPKRTTTADVESFEANNMQAQKDSSGSQTPSSMTIYEDEHANMPNLVNYGIGSTDCDMLSGGSASHDALFAMEAEELFTSIY